MTLNIKHQTEEQIFTVDVDGHQACINYELEDSIMHITHTNVPEEIGGRGIAGQITQFALETARQQNWKVVPGCTYTQAYLKRHPEYADILA